MSREGWSRGHKLEDQQRLREQATEELLAQLGLSRDEFEAIKRDPEYLNIVALAIEKGLSFWNANAEYALMESRRPSPTNDRVRIEFAGMTFKEIAGLNRQMNDEL